MLSGEIIKIFVDLTYNNTEITAFLLDKLKKRMFLGDKSGHISSLNAENGKKLYNNKYINIGAKIKNLPRHQADVMHIVECKESKMFVSASIDNVIHLVLDNEFGETQLLRQINIKDEIITQICYFSEFK